MTDLTISSLELIQPFSIDSFKLVLVQYLSVDSRICHLGLELVAGNNSTDASWGASQDQVALLVESALYRRWMRSSLK
jgi:hypothetical protein